MGRPDLRLVDSEAQLDRRDPPERLVDQEDQARAHRRRMALYVLMLVASVVGLLLVGAK